MNDGRNYIKGRLYGKKVIKSGMMTKLKELHLYKNQIGDQGMVYLSNALPRMKALSKLYLYKNQIGDQGIASVSNVLPQMKA